LIPAIQDPAISEKIMVRSFVIRIDRYGTWRIRSIMGCIKLLLAAALGLAIGCSPLTTLPAPAPTGLAGPPAGNLVDTRWQLVSMGPAGAQEDPLEGTTVTLEFQRDGLVGGSSGCNSYGGTYQVTGNMLAFGEMSTTLRACADERANRQEQIFLDALQTISTFEKTDARLTLWYDGGQSTMTFSQTP
jgi:putative lipoprotein